MHAFSTPSVPVRAVPFVEAFQVWCRVALLSFGGPAGQIAVMHRILVDEKQWISEERFLHALNYCMLLPGPEAQQLATYIGWLLHRTKGGLVAGSLFILPGVASILGLSILYAGFHDVQLVQAIFFGLKPAVMAIVVDAVLRISKRVLKNRMMMAIAVLSFVAIFFFNVPFPWLVVTAGTVGMIGGRLAPAGFNVIGGNQTSAPAGPAETPAIVMHTVRPSWTRALLICSVFLPLWFGPLWLLKMTLGTSSVFFQEAAFFSKAAVVTFGGAYAVLAYIGQQAVENFAWLQPGEMMDGLGMAETTPGPLIMVVQFVGFMGAYRNPGPCSPMIAGVLGSLITVWSTFVPCFFWIFLGAPSIERLRGNRLLSSALSAITAAVVGVILNLAIWFSVHTLFSSVTTSHVGRLRLLIPEWTSINTAACAVAVLAFLLTFQWKRGMATTLAICCTVGVVLHWLA
ncbi:MAG: chromate efflux transporter [Planctomycetaceae bacterium]